MGGREGGRQRRERGREEGRERGGPRQTDRDRQTDRHPDKSKKERNTNSQTANGQAHPESRQTLRERTAFAHVNNLIVSNVTRHTSLNRTVYTQTSATHAEKRCQAVGVDVHLQPGSFSSAPYKRRFNSLHTHVLICGHRHRVACLQTSTSARCVLK